ncbi:MAG: hypothetical protein ACREOC_05765 [Gemmatimonadales bacterium]
MPRPFEAGVALAVLCAAAPISAQNRSIDTDGTGSLTLPNSGFVRLGRGTFQQSGEAVTLNFYGTNIALPLIFEGRARTGSSGELSIEITGGLREATTQGTGTLALTGNELGRVQLRGTTKGGAFALVFEGSGGGQPGGGGDGDWNAGGTGARPLDISVVGTGTYRLGGRQYGVREARVRLRDNGRAELRFDGDRQTSGEGTWRSGYGGRADIQIHTWNGQRTTGSAAVSFRGNDIERVGVSLPAQNASVEFRPSDHAGGGGGTPGARPVNTSFVGTGGFRERGRTYPLSEASVRLHDNGQAELRFQGQRQTGGRGRWSANGNYATLTIVEWDGRMASGSGNVVFSGGQPNRVNVTLQGGRSITFRSTPQIQPR